jgi:hypothetical protein
MLSPFCDVAKCIRKSLRSSNEGSQNLLLSVGDDAGQWLCKMTERVLQKNVKHAFKHVIVDAFKRNACCQHFVTLPNAPENL